MSRTNRQTAPRRATVPTLATLEDRRLMTRGLIPAMSPIAMAAPGGPPALAGTIAASDARLAGGDAVVSASTLPAFDPTSTKDWIYSGSDAQFGPSTSYVVLGGGNAWPTPTITPPTASDPSGVQAKLDAAFAKQSADFQAVQDKSEVTPRLLASLRQAREKVASEAGTADAALVKTLQDGTEAVRQSGTFTEAQQAQIQADYTAALKGAGVSDASIAGLFAAQDAVRAASGVTAADLKTLADDQAAVQALMDALPKDHTLAYTTDIAMSSRGPAGASGGAGAVTTTTSATDTPLVTTAAPKPIKASSPGVSAANVASVGAMPTGVQAPGRDVPSALPSATANTVRPAGFEASTQMARLSRRTATSGAGRLQGVANGTRALNGRGTLNVQAVPATVVRRVPAAFRGMRATPQAFQS